MFFFCIWLWYEFFFYRLRGMPYSATIDDIVSFLGDYSLYILPSGVHIVLNQQVTIWNQHLLVITTDFLFNKQILKTG